MVDYVMIMAFVGMHLAFDSTMHVPQDKQQSHLSFYLKKKLNSILLFPGSNPGIDGFYYLVVPTLIVWFKFY